MSMSVHVLDGICLHEEQKREVAAVSLSRGSRVREQTEDYRRLVHACFVGYT